MGPAAPPGRDCFVGLPSCLPAGWGFYGATRQPLGRAPFDPNLSKEQQQLYICTWSYICVGAHVYGCIYVVLFVLLSTRSFILIALHVHTITLHVYVLCHSYAFCRPG